MKAIVYHINEFGFHPISKWNEIKGFLRREGIQSDIILRE